MQYIPTSLPGVYQIISAPIADLRGAFTRIWCREEFETHGLCTNFDQCSISSNRICGTLRGLHYQAAPYAEIKLVRCLRGAIYDVVVDLRHESPTYLHWCAVELTERNQTMLYIPEGCAHGFQTLEDNTDVFYQIHTTYHPESARGVRWDDPALAILWPDTSMRIISERDQSYPDIRRA